MESFAYLIEKQSILKGIRCSKNTKKNKQWNRNQHAPKDYKDCEKEI